MASDAETKAVLKDAMIKVLFNKAIELALVFRRFEMHAFTRTSCSGHDALYLDRCVFKNGLGLCIRTAPLRRGICSTVIRGNQPMTFFVCDEINKNKKRRQRPGAHIECGRREIKKKASRKTHGSDIANLAGHSSSKQILSIFSIYPVLH